MDVDVLRLADVEQPPDGLQHRGCGAGRVVEVARGQVRGRVGDQHRGVVAAAPAVVGDPRDVGVVVDEGPVEATGRADAVPGAAGPPAGDGDDRLPLPAQLVADRVVAHEPAGLRVGHGEDDGVRVELLQRLHLSSLDGQVGREVLDQ